MTTPLFRALVVEDEWPARNYLVELLEASAQVQVVGAVSTIEEARQALSVGSQLQLDVAFVDVNIVGSGADAGLALVRSLAGQSHAPAFVLATAFKQHALEAFELGVVDYLLKPFTEERVSECLKRLRSRRPPAPAPRTPPRIVARNGKNLVFLEIDEVWAFESSERLTSVHTVHGQFDIDLSLANIEASLGPLLTRVHRSWLVNARAVRELGRDGNESWVFVGTGLRDSAEANQRGLTIPVARERAQAIRDMLLEQATGVRRG